MPKSLPSFSPAFALLFSLLLSACAPAAETPLAALPPAVAITAIANTVTATPLPEATVFRIPTLIPTPTRTPNPTRTPTSTPPMRTVDAAEQGIWISAAELAALPTAGLPWERLLETATDPLDAPNISDQDSNHDVQTLSVALVYARTGDANYRRKAADAIRAVTGTGENAPAISIGRNLASYVIAADLIDLAAYDSGLDGQFREWIYRAILQERQDGSVVADDEEGANSLGRFAGASRVAVAAYLGDAEELSRAARVFKGFLGDRRTYAGFNFGDDLSWQHVRLRPVGVNPAGAIKDGFMIDGALPEEMRRGCSFQAPPCPTDSPWTSLQGIVVEAHLLHRQGYDAWNWEDRAVLRAVQFLYSLQQIYPTAQWWATGDDLWVPWLVNNVYEVAFPVEEARLGKNMTWTDWTHGS